MYLQTQTWPEVENYLSRNTCVLIPIGSTEQHGPTGFIGTDALCPEIVAKALADKVEIMIAPTISVGMAQHHLGFAGSITLRPTTLIAVVRDYVMSLYKHGFTHFLFLNGHGGNVASVEAAFSEIYAEFSFGAREGQTAPQCLLRNWWMGKRVGEISKREFGEREGSHATPSEVSLTYYGYPDAAARVKPDGVLSPGLAPKGPIRDAADYRARFPDGRIGSDPSGASVEIGEALCAAAVADLLPLLENFQKGAL